MTLSVSYASQRNEVLRWYWQMWRRRLWKTHCVVFLSVAVGASLAIFGGVPTGWSGLYLVAVIGLVPLMGFVLFPILSFKPEVRTLSIDDSGIATTIGKLSATIGWSDIADVREDGESLVIQRRNLNSFIVPARAFLTVEAKTEFTDYVREMVLCSASR